MGFAAAARGPSGSLAAALAAVYAAAAVGLGAYAAHAALAPDAERLRLASLYLLVHALAVLALLGRSGRLLGIARWALLLGVSLFSGSLTGAALAGWTTAPAPVGGIVMIAAWLLLALALVRGEGRQA